MTEIAIKVTNLDVQIGKKQILSNMSLEIKKGEIFGLIGPSGAGKTTLVKTIIGMEKATTGQTEVLNKVMPSLPVISKIGYMAQSDALYTDLTAKENLDFFASLYSIKGNTKKERICYAADLVNLQPDLTKKVSNYSGGMKRRLSLAISVLANPDVLILDEPTVGIDPELRKSIWDELGELKANGKCILVTTHVMDEAEKCDRLAMIRNGKIIAVGTPQELSSKTSSGKLEDAFLEFGGES
ncbi:ABC transporter ATP-binding protein [Listeria ivanovii]|uniref:ABC transporter ATP-binding protein n=2 Tax=Listeria ivanovii TaxID=1638 RepID=A0ABS1G271_LISIV|nr:ABC transporter ATP-binding protein [Listeria ivanovii]AIS59345.1 glycosyl transferase family 2 [Listeria ivanovii subsp. londoniensis]AIS62177.1 glycosyl transferase family 2 [Listeria ivanovii subsp. londoniensis]MBC2255655.1 ABC transporter ATP-binding protein [Listeria ivanovii]MBK1960791.1 ABC transporter ATP-binding protein [Listeria ivanovii subsp. londoniensis]MBK1965446.1 ABC transporter ATP-binding protein [Listeria ivanovii subsp. londoniensis]